MLYRPRAYNLVTCAILIGSAFTLRYTAIYYPIIMCLALLLSRHKLGIKLAGTLAPLLLMIPFVLFTRAETKAVTGTAEFSVFGGWQIANNALYMYQHINVDPQKLPPATVELDAMVKKYHQSAPPGWFNFDEYPGTFFIKHSDAPLKQYMILKYRKALDTNQFQAWGKVSPVYSSYGNYLITHYPVSFARYYMWLNVKNYFSPFLEKYGSYNMETNDIWDLGQYWFHYPSPQTKVASKKLLGTLFLVYPSVFLVLNLYLAYAFISAIVRRRLKMFTPIFRNVLWLTVGFLLINFAFSVFATPVVLRYQVVPFALLFTFSWLLFEFTDSKYLNTDKKIH